VSCGDSIGGDRNEETQALLATGGKRFGDCAARLPLDGFGGEWQATKVAITDDQQSFDFRAGRVCSFELAGTPVSNNQYVMAYPADANGDVWELINGALKEHVTNVDTGKSIVVNVSGPATEIVHPDGTAD
jgi:hypothetical protein